MNTLELQSWLILFASATTAAAAVVGLVSDHYRETLAENIGLSGIALSGFVVVAQIAEHEYTHLSGVTLQSVSMAWYAVALVFRNWGRP